MTDKRTTNAEFARTNELFRDACFRCWGNQQPSKRQASKYRRGRGRAFQARNA